MDNEPNDSVEEGEILDYEPLERPSVASARLRRGVVNKGDSDTSDTDDGISCKRPKYHSSDFKRKSKYNVWASEFEDTDLLDGLCNWDAGLKNTVMDRSRAVESYYCQSFEDSSKNSDECVSRKRRLNEKIDLRSKLSHKNSKDKGNSLSQPRYLSELRVASEDSVSDIAHDIMSKLCEDNEDLIMRAVSVLGSQKAIDLFNKTRKFEEEGGMMVLNGSRRRTPGGVFIQLIKRDNQVTPEQKQKIFIENNKTSTKKEKRKSSHKSVHRSTDSNPDEASPLLTRKELALTLACSSEGGGDNDCGVKNPPPSPATVGEQSDERQLSENESEVKDNEDVKNPPPSPATHGDRQLNVYDDVFDIDIDSEMEFT